MRGPVVRANVAAVLLGVLLFVALALAFTFAAPAAAQERDGVVYANGVALPVLAPADSCRAKSGAGCVCLDADVASEALVRLRTEREVAELDVEPEHSWVTGPSWTAFGIVLGSVAVMAGAVGYIAGR